MAPAKRPKSVMNEVLILAVELLKVLKSIECCWNVVLVEDSEDDC